MQQKQYIAIDLKSFYASVEWERQGDERQRNRPLVYRAKT